MSIEVTPNTPRHIAVQWDGTNEEDLGNIFITWGNMDPQASYNTTVNQDGSVRVYFPNHYTDVIIPANGWLVSGPKWGSYGNSVPPTIYSNDEFTARFLPQGS